MAAVTPASFRRWPFWLLIAAWVCANSPQAAIYAALSWMAEARHFSHQQQLKAGVERLLAGEQAPAAVSATPAVPAERSPLVPSDAVLKKISLALERGTEVLPPNANRFGCGLADMPRPESPAARPPHEPPRGGLTV